MLSDRDVWQAVLDGDARAYGEIWDRHRDRVFRNLVRLGSARSETEDLTAVVFLELWRRRAAVRFVDDSLLPWLLVTAQNVLRNASRARRRYEQFLHRLPQPAHAADPADIVADRESEAMHGLRSVLSVSRPDDRLLLVLTAMEGLTVREAATAVGISESAAKMRLSRLRGRIKDATGSAVVEGGIS